MEIMSVNTVHMHGHMQCSNATLFTARCVVPRRSIAASQNFIELQAALEEEKDQLAEEFWTHESTTSSKVEPFQSDSIRALSISRGIVLSHSSFFLS
jgi:hypothetical protein